MDTMGIGTGAKGDPRKDNLLTYFKYVRIGLLDKATTSKLLIGNKEFETSVLK